MAQIKMQYGVGTRKPTLSPNIFDGTQNSWSRMQPFLQVNNNIVYDATNSCLKKVTNTGGLRIDTTSLIDKGYNVVDILIQTASTMNDITVVPYNTPDYARVNNYCEIASFDGTNYRNIPAGTYRFISKLGTTGNPATSFFNTSYFSQFNVVSSLANRPMCIGIGRSNLGNSIFDILSIQMRKSEELVLIDNYGVVNDFTMTIYNMRMNGPSTNITATYDKTTNTISYNGTSSGGNNTYTYTYPIVNWSITNTNDPSCWIDGFYFTSNKITELMSKGAPIKVIMEYEYTNSPTTPSTYQVYFSRFIGNNDVWVNINTTSASGTGILEYTIENPSLMANNLIFALSINNLNNNTTNINNSIRIKTLKLESI